MTSARAPRVRHIQLPPAQGRLSRSRRLYRGLRGAIGMPFYAAAAHARGLPGLEVRLRIAALAARLSARRRASVRSTLLYDMVCFPMDSTRYFEFSFVWRRLHQLIFRRYLDVSSPRLLPLLLLDSMPELRATLLNPDATDLEATRQLVEAAGFHRRCTCVDKLAADARFDASSFDVITSISVVEHIRDDVEAVAQLWRALVRGGRLLLSMPCAAVGEEQFVNVRHYAFAEVEGDGTTFHQYLYDQAMLERIYAITGRPNHLEIVGERRADSHRALYERKWIDADYPFWREPWFMSRDFQRYDSLSELPGEGVVLLEFVK